MLPFKIVDRVKFFVERQLVKGAVFQLMVVGVFIGLISVLGGLLVVFQGDSFDNVASAIWWAFLRLTDPGYLGDDSGSWQRLVSTILTVLGYVVFMGTLVAILTRWLIAKMSDLERGLTPVTLKNHLVILGWSQQTPPLIAELFGSSSRMQRFLQKHDTQKLRLVVLAEAAGAEQLHALSIEPGIGRRARDIILRSGLAIQPEALHRVACLDAAAVIVPSVAHQPDRVITSDVETVKALLSIAAQARFYRSPMPFVVAEIQDVRKLPVVASAYPGNIEVVAGDATISRLLVQNVLHPGLSEIYNELLTAGDGNEIYVRGGETAQGKTLGEVACERPNAILLGLLHPASDGWQVNLLAPASTRIQSEDRIVYLARAYQDTEATPKQTPLPLIERGDAVRRAVTRDKQSGRILILGWNRRVPSLIAELSSYVDRRFECDMVSLVPADERERELKQYLGQRPVVSCRQVEVDYLVEEELKTLRPADYTAVILLSSDRFGSGEEADARTMVGYLQLEDVLRDSRQRPRIILELSDPDNRHLLYGHRSEMMIAPMILSHVLAQVALRRELRVVLEELFTVGGAEIQLRDPEDYVLPASVDFYVLEKLLAEQGETALGVLRAQPDGKNRRLLLNPPRKTRLELQSGDQLVVLCLT